MEKLTNIPVDSIKLEGLLNLTDQAKGLVIFVHGSGSSRHSPRNNFVAQVLQKRGLATLLFDLLTEKEDLDYQARFDIDLLTKRTLKVTDWLKNNEKTRNLKFGYFGSSTGAAGAINAASLRPAAVKAVVSRGGRPDLASRQALEKLKSPILLVVGGQDTEVISMNQQAYDSLNCRKEISIIPGATHLFEEPGALEQVAQEAADWFSRFLNQDG